MIPPCPDDQPSRPSSRLSFHQAPTADRPDPMSSLLLIFTSLHLFSVLPPRLSRPVSACPSFLLRPCRPCRAARSFRRRNPGARVSVGWFFRRRSRVQHACRATLSMFCHQYPWFGLESHAAAPCHLMTPCRHHQSSSCSTPCCLDHSARRPHPYAHTDRRSNRPPIMLVLTSPPDLTAVIATITPHSSPPPFFTTTLLRAHSSRPFFTTTLACHFLALALFGRPCRAARSFRRRNPGARVSVGWFFGLVLQAPFTRSTCLPCHSLRVLSPVSVVWAPSLTPPRRAIS
jgi:hypothetical protein